MASHPMLRLIDKYLADLPPERDLVQAQAVRDLLLDIRLTFMVAGDEEPPPAAVAARRGVPGGRPMTLKPPRTRPPEVVLDVHGRQELAPGFRRYEYCAGNCGWLIGCGDAIDTVWHQSCWDKAHPEHSDGST